MDRCAVSVPQTVALPGLLFASHRHFSGITVVYQASVRLRQVDTLIICMTILYLLILIIRSCLFRLTFRHRASCILGQAFHYSPENAFYVLNQQIYFII